MHRLSNEVKKLQQESILIKQENEIIKYELAKYDRERNRCNEMKPTSQEKLGRHFQQVVYVIEFHSYSIIISRRI